MSTAEIRARETPLGWDVWVRNVSAASDGEYIEQSDEDVWNMLAAIDARATPTVWIIDESGARGDDMDLEDALEFFGPERS
jgi:hypothetical protein